MTDIAELNALRARIDELEAQVRGQSQEPSEQVTTRRSMLRLAGAAAVGGLATVIASDPVAATDNSAVLAGVSANTATLPTGIAVAAASTVYGLGCYETGLAAPHADLGRPAVFGHATSTAFTNGVAGHCTGVGSGVYGLHTGPNGNSSGVKGTSTEGVGVEGSSENNFGVWGRSVVGNGVQGSSASATGVLAYGAVGVFGQGPRGALQLGAFSATAPPSRATPFSLNTLETDDAGNVWFCYESGTPGKWRKLAGPGTAGAFHALTPTRVYDSRAAAPTPGLLATGNNRLVSVADGRDNAGNVTTPNLVPTGATAVAANVTITGTVGGFGYLAINPGGNTVESASTINWSDAGQTLANGVTLTLNTNRQLTVICNGGGSTHFLIDISGYYL
ncbi:MAG: hypothetical protein K8R99_10190 [Actinomycetia bacterium]|nr:hypothetical protein [Actinomycetes bacterium]